MATKKLKEVEVENVNSDPTKSVEEIIAENQQLLAKVEELEAKNVTALRGDDTLSKFMSEMDKIRKKGRVEANTIRVQEICDHKNISLWTKDGKRIGPLHRMNAERTFKMFYELGIILSVDQPSEVQIEAYKQTDDYKQRLAEHKRKRAIKDKSRKSGQMQKYAEEIAKLTGKTVDAINRVFKSNEVQPLSEGLNKQ
jgi:hypothetical protein